MLIEEVVINASPLISLFRSQQADLLTDVTHRSSFLSLGQSPIHEFYCRVGRVFFLPTVPGKVGKKKTLPTLQDIALFSICCFFSV